MGKGKGPLLILILVVVVAGAAYWLTSRDASEPEAPAPEAPTASAPETPTAEPEAPTVAAPPFGGPDDTGYAAEVWAYLAENQLAGTGLAVAEPYPGGAPHGELLETVTVDVEIAGHAGTLIVKTNFAAPEGETITAEQVMADPNAHLVAVTIMFQREDGYDSENANWFWAKYLPDGTLDKNPAGMELAGKVGNREQNAGCLGCHDDAPGGDYIFTN
jgi:hypothetical protein